MPEAAGAAAEPAVPAARTRPAAGVQLGALYLLLIGSGFAGLGYQMAWTRMLSVSLGHEYVAVLAVLAAFFVGLAAGGFALNGVLRRTGEPTRWYVGLELVIGVWALLSIPLLPVLNELSAGWMGTEPGALRHWTLAFGTSLLALLPATAAMGATLPAIARLGSAIAPRQRAVPGFYAANTAGAMLGALATTFFLLPSLGLKATLALFAAVNFAVAATAWLLWGRERRSLKVPPDGGAAAPASAAAGLPALLFATGLLGLGYEVLVVRVLSQVLEGTVYSFAAVLTVYLGGTAAGAALYQRRLAPLQAREAAVAATLLHLTAFACLLGMACLWAAEDIYRWVFEGLGPGSVTAMAAELAVATTVFLLPTLGMGALFSHLAQSGSARHGLGRLLGINTLGAALAPVLFGVILLPLLGARLSLLCLCAAYLPLPLLLSPRPARWLTAVPALLTLLALLVLSPPLRFVPGGERSEVIAYREGVIAAVAVIEEPDRSRHLAVNNHFLMGGTASRFSDHRQTHLPLLLHGAARSALYLGLGTGITLQAAQYHPGLRATGVELVPEMLPLMPLFGVDLNGEHWRQPPRVLAADARRFVTADRDHYDVIIAEVFHPSRDGAGSLYTVEHFAAVRERLAPDGLFCQWLPLFQLELDTLRMIVRSFLQVFPAGQLHLAHFSLGQPLLCLLGGRHEPQFTADWLVQRVDDPALQQQLVQLRLNSDFALFGGYLGGPRALARFAGGGALNTDDRPAVTYMAPAFVYGEPALPAQRLQQLVRSMAPERDTLLAGQDRGGEFDRRLRRYWRARDVFLAAGIGVRPSADVVAMLRQIREPLLRAVRISPDFLPAYDPLLQMARSLAPRQPAAAIGLLRDLEDAAPLVPWATQLRRQIEAGRTP